jgi:hypothetical protein
MAATFYEKVCFAFESHGIAIKRVDETTIDVVGADLKVWAELGQVTVHPSSTVLQANIAYSAPALGERWIKQCVAGTGDDREAAEINALWKILHSSFHVVLNALGGHTCDADGTDWEDWTGPSGAWRVNASKLVSVGSSDASKIPYTDLYEQLRAAFVARATPGLHWLETFASFVEGKIDKVQIELDGEPWVEGEEIVRAWPYQPSEPHLFLRHFLIATPAK